MKSHLIMAFGRVVLKMFSPKHPRLFVEAKAFAARWGLEWCLVKVKLEGFLERGDPFLLWYLWKQQNLDRDLTKKDMGIYS